MVTKTLTITEGAYNLLAERKLSNESFSREIERILSHRKKKSLFDFFGVLTKEEGENLERLVNRRRKFNREMKQKRYS